VLRLVRRVHPVCLARMSSHCALQYTHAACLKFLFTGRDKKSAWRVTKQFIKANLPLGVYWEIGSQVRK